MTNFNSPNFNSLQIEYNNITKQVIILIFTFKNADDKTINFKDSYNVRAERWCVLVVNLKNESLM